MHSRLEVAPKPWTYDYRDYFGTQVIAFEVVDPHASMTVTATSTVQVSRPATHPPLSTWDQLAAREVSDRWTEYLMRPDLVAPTEDFVQRAKELASAASLPGRGRPAAVRPGVRRGRVPPRRHRRTHDRGPFVAAAGGRLPGHGPPGHRRAALDRRPGALRLRLLPPLPDPVVGEHVVGASHAWVEWWDDGWHPFDLTNGEEPGDRYVAVATGRDYDDVKPLSGIYSGAETSEMTVSVEITRLA